MPSRKQDEDFAQLISENCIDEIKISKTSLDTAIEYIADNINPEDVFSDTQLSAWAESNGYTKE